MQNMLALATRSGVVLGRSEGDEWVEAGQSMENRQVTSIIAWEGALLGGTTEGIFHSVDGGRSWKAANSGLTTRHVRWLAHYPGLSDLKFAGTEPAGIFVSYDDGHSWRSCPEVAGLREKYNWRLPYSPAAGCVRGFAFHGLRAYAAVEDGCVLISDDSGETWRVAEGSRGGPDHNPAPNFVHSDVHSIAVHPSSSDLVYAPTGGGLYRSEDGGVTWKMLYDCYCRDLWVNPQDPDHLIFGPADGVDYRGRIEVSNDGGRSWRMAPTGLSVPWSDYMVERFTQVNEDLLAVLSNGELYSASLASMEWIRILPEVEGVSAAAGMPAGSS